MTILQANFTRDITKPTIKATKAHHYFEFGLDIKPFEVIL
jgi:hypothetical protein